MRLIFVVSLFAFFACGIKGSPRPPKSVFVPDEQVDAGTEASQGTREQLSASGRDEGDAKQSPSAAEKPTRDAGIP